jgi:hypothetical protein
MTFPVTDKVILERCYEPCRLSNGSVYLRCGMQNILKARKVLQNCPTPSCILHVIQVGVLYN